MLGHFFPLCKAARIGRVRRLAVGFAAVALCGGLLTQAAVADGNPVKTPAPNPGTPNPDNISWQGLNWGIGIATDFDIGGSRVANATIVNNIVRLTDTSTNVGISFVLEAHYFFKEWLPANGCSMLNCNDVATGPFIAIEVGTGSTATPAAGGVVSSFAMGWMVGLHHPDDPTNQSWNFGLGLRVNPSAQVLGPGFVANQPPPAGETAIRYLTEPRVGVMLMSSFSF
jgi:hypothetical protein